MIKEIKIQETVCDGCRKIEEMPTAIAGSYDSGWNSIEDLDLCPVCYGLLCLELVEKTDYADLEDIIFKLKDKYPISSIPTEYFTNSGI